MADPPPEYGAPHRFKIPSYTPLVPGSEWDSMWPDSYSAFDLDLDFDARFPGPPPLAVTTDPATGVSGTDATLNGELTSLGGESSVDVTFLYRAQGNRSGTEQTTAGQTLTLPGTFSETVSGLTPGATYVFQARRPAGATPTSAARRRSSRGRS